MHKIINIKTLDKSRLLSLIPALWISLLDICVTIFGQSDDYWKGNLNVANEGNPIGAFFMRNHVSGLFLISGLWVIIYPARFQGFFYYLY